MKIDVDTEEIEHLDVEFREATLIGLRRILERGEQILRDEVPKVTHNLSQGISSDVDEAAMHGTLIVSARSGRTGARSATVHYPSGKTKSISLRPQPAFNYAEVVARGRGAIRPKNAKVLLIPGSPRSGESYLTSEGKTFVLRPSAGPTKPNPFDERTADRLGNEAGGIVEKAITDFFE